MAQWVQSIAVCRGSDLAVKKPALPAERRSSAGVLHSALKCV